MVQPGRRGTNLPRMGDYNQRVVLDQIRRSRAGVSRVELVAATGLSAQTISNVVTRLVELGLVVEGDRQILGRGKPRTMLHLRAEGGFALGAHIDPVLVTLALVDLTGAVRVQSVVETPFGPDAAVAVIAQQVAELIEAAGVDRSQILGFGVAAPGPIDADRGHVIHPPLLAGWGDYPLRDRVAQATGFETVIEKDVSAAMAAELWQGQHNLAQSHVAREEGAQDDAFERLSLLYTPAPDTVVEICFDRGAVKCGDRVEALSELELELKSGPPWRLYETALALMAGTPFRLELRSKAFRGYALLGGVTESPAKAVTTDLRPDLSVEAAFRAIAFACLSQLQANQHGIAL